MGNRFGYEGDADGVGVKYGLTQIQPTTIQVQII